ncbi:MAG TPA: glycosyltransferase family 4 protein [Ramlibacter sp.]|nr:glycosyltransferase family 4 protein [Ramlibacter sp.]
MLQALSARQAGSPRSRDDAAAPGPAAAPGVDASAGFAGLRIGLVGPLPPPAGGMANQTRQLSELLRGAQAHVELVQTNAAYRPVWAASVPVLRALFRLLPYLDALWRTAGRSDVFHVMANSGWSWHLFAAPAIWIATARGVPVVVNYRGGEAAGFLGRSQTLVRWSMKRAAALAVPSGFLAEVFGRFGMGSQVVPNIVDLQRFRPAEGRRPGGARLLVARNLEPIYDNATALRAFALLCPDRPDARLTIAGSGPQEAQLRALANELGVQDQVHFAGRLDRDAMAAAYREADVVLNPSLVDNMPNSLLEAMASGVPVVSTDVGGVPFIVDHERTALLVPAAAPEAMAAAVQRLLADAGLADRLRNAGLVEVQRYTWPQVAPRLAALYRSVRACART